MTNEAKAIEQEKLETVTVNLDVNHTAEQRAELAWKVCNGQGPVNPNLVKVFEAYHNLDQQEFEQRMFGDIEVGAPEPVVDAPSSEEAA